jgi:Fic family protein
MQRDQLSGEIRERLVRLPPPFQAHYGVVPPPPPETGIPLGGVLKRHQAAQSALARVEAIASELHDPYLISRILTRREAVSSSSIEGTNSTLDEILSVEETGDEDARAAARQVRSYATTLDALVPEARRIGDKIFTRQLIARLHGAVMEGDDAYEDRPGELRDRVVWIGGQGNIAYSTWNPPPPDRLEECLDQTIAYLRNEGMHSMTQDLIVRMAIGHAHFEAVHPFRDGNGRVGRLLLPLMMVAEGRSPLYLAPYVEAHRADYYAALKAAQQRLEWPAIIGFLSDAIVGTVEELMVTRQALIALEASWLERRRFRRGSAALRALALLPHYPVITAKRLAALLKVSAPQAAQAITLLSEVGILSERTGYRRNRVFAAEEALAIIDRPFGEAPIVPESPARRL